MVRIVNFIVPSLKSHEMTKKLQLWPKMLRVGGGMGSPMGGHKMCKKDPKCNFDGKQILIGCWKFHYKIIGYQVRIKSWGVRGVIGLAIGSHKISKTFGWCVPTSLRWHWVASSTPKPFEVTWSSLAYQARKNNDFGVEYFNVNVDRENIENCRV